MKNVFTKVTVGALMISLSITASAAGVKDAKNRDVRSKDVIEKAVIEASAALKAAGVVKATRDRMEKSGLIGKLAERNGIDHTVLIDAARKISLSAIGDLSEGLGSGDSKREQLAEKVLKIAAKVDENDTLGLAVVEALSQGAGKSGDIFKSANPTQLTQALILAEKMEGSRDSRVAVVDYLSSKKGNGKVLDEKNAADLKEIEDFIEALKGCVKRG